MRMQNDKAEADPAKDDVIKAESKGEKCKYFNGDIANLNWSVDLFIQKISAEPILRAKLAMQNCAKADIQKSVNGGKRNGDVKDKTVITFT